MSSVKRNRYIDGKLLLAYPDDYTVLDIETTGLSPQNDYITEISAIKYRNNRRVDEFSSLVKPELSIPYYITRLTGIDDAMVADAPAIDEVILSFMEFLADDELLEVTPKSIRLRKTILDKSLRLKAESRKK